MPIKITGPHGPSLPIQSSADFNKSWTCKNFTANTMATPAVAQKSHVHRPLTLEETFCDCAKAPVSGLVCTECEPLGNMLPELDSRPFTLVPGAHGCFPMIALATKADDPEEKIYQQQVEREHRPLAKPEE